MENFRTIKRNLTLSMGFLIALLLSNGASAQATFTSGSTATQMLNAVTGQLITITNETITSGDPTQFGIFSNGIAGGGFEIDSAVCLTSSTVTESFTDNSSTAISFGPGTTFSDPDLVSVDPSAIYDVAIVEFDFTLSPGAQGVRISYQFGSDEYPDYVCSIFNDVFGFFISGGDLTGTENIALVPGTTNSVSVNNINNGSAGAFADGSPCDLTQAANFIDNGNGVPGPVFTEYNGITKKIINVRALTPGVTYHMKLAVADVGDGSFDSGVFIEVIEGVYIPSANPDFPAPITEDAGPTIFDVTTNDTYLGTDTLSVTVVSGPTSGGTATIINGDSIVYTPPANFCGADTIIYEVCNEAGACDIDTVFITVTCVDDPPDAITDNVTTNEDTNTIIDVQDNDIEVDGDVLTTTIVSGPTSGGTAVVVNGDSIDYTPPAEFSGVDTIIYQICDPTPNCDTDTIFITVNAVNDAPDANTDNVSVNEDDSNIILDPQANDSDIEGDPLTTTIVSGPTSGGTAVVVNGDSINYTPPADFNGVDTIVYQVCDPGPACDTDTIFITVNSVNDAPEANTDNVTANTSSNTIIDVQDNDVDVDGDPLTTTILSGPTSGGTAVVVNGDSIDYTPPGGFSGVDTIIYQICDPGPLCDTDTIFITVNNVPDANTDNVSVNEDDSNVILDPQGNDIDLDGDVLTTTIVSGPTSGGTAVVVNGDSIDYTPPADFNGVDTIIYQICDPGPLCDTDTIFVTVNAVNDSPNANGDNVSTNEDSGIVVDVQANDTDVDGDALTTTIVSGPTSGGTAVVVNGDSIDYTPPADFSGVDTIIYQICDPGPLCDTDTIFITVNPVNDAPDANTDNVSVNEDDSNVILDPQANDTDTEGDALTTTIISGPTSGGTAVVVNGDSIDYTPPADFNGVDTIIYQICDPGPLCDTDTIFITVNNVPDAPDANTDNVSTNEDSGIVVDVQANDTDNDGDVLTTTIVSGPTSGGTAVVVNGDSIDYTPPADFSGVDTIIYQICDPGPLCDTDTIFITVNPVNDAPDANTDNVSVNEDDSNVILDPQGNDTDTEGDALTTTIISGPTSGGTAIVVNGDSIDYTPPADFNGVDTIIYQICDPGPLCDTDTIFITVNNVPDAPDANTDNVSTNEDSGIVVDVQANDTDNDGDVLTTTIVSGPTSGGTAVVVNGDSIDYTPPADFSGVDTIIYQICDPGPLCDTDTIFITVNPVNDAPDANTDNVSVNEDDSNVILDPQANDTDTEGDALTTTIISGPTSGGTAIVVNGDSIDYTPPADFNGVDTIIYQICDPGPLCDTDTIFITVNNVPDAPDANTDNVSTNEDSGIVVDVQANDTDNDGDVLTTTIVSGPTSGGTAVVVNGDSIDYTPPADFSGVDTIIYQICDPGPLCDTDTIFITVNPVNDAPDANTDNVSVNEDDMNIILDPQGNDTDVEGDALTTTIISGPTSGGTAIVVNGDSIDYTPPADFNGVDTIIYQICDPGPLCDIDTIFVTVNNVPDAPDANTDNVSTNEDSGIVVDVQANDTDNDGDVLTTTIVSGPTSGGTAVVVNGDSIDYTPPADFSGVDTIIYQICDPGPLCDTDTIFITVNPVNDAPDANTDVVGTNQNTGVVIDVQDNDSDVEGDPLTTSIVSGPTSGGTAVVVNGDSIDYTSPIGFSGTDTIIYQVCDPGPLCDIDTVFIVVAPDTDGDGVLDADELANGTDPNDPCSFNVANISIQATDTGDCDGDGVTNADEINGTDGDPFTTADNTDPNDPCDYNTADVTTTQGGAWNAADCDGDGVTNGDEVTDGTNPLDPCEMVTTSVTLVATDMSDCDGDGVPNSVEINGTDGDPLTTGDNTSPLDSCSYNAGDVTLAPSAAWLAADCDGDGVTNGQEITDGTNPQDPCSLTIASVTIPATDTGDCDGDGVTNADEINGTDGDPLTAGDNTDPNDPCSLNLADVTIPATDTGDCDGDGVTNADEINGTDGDPLTTGDNTNPNDPCSLNVADVTIPATDTGDCDGDGVTNADEINGTDGDPLTTGDNTNPTDPCSLNLADVTLVATDMGDCDGDGVPNSVEINGTDGDPLTAGDNTDPNDPCSLNLTDQTLTPNAAWDAADCDGDGVTNAQELADGTNPQDPCDLTIASVTITATDTGDCDGDGVTNADEINGTDGDPLTAGDNTDPNDPCSLNLADQTVTPNAAWNAADCDGDGVTNGQELTDGTDPQDPCSLTLSSVTLVATDMGDCDGDGVPNSVEINGTDGDPLTTGDNTDPNDPCSFNLADQSLTPSAAWDAADCDGDGVTNAQELIDGTDPLDDCSFNVASITLTVTSTSDCDGDGVTNADEATDGTDPFDDCSFNTSSITTTVTSTSDCDGDGVTNADEATDGTDPFDPCGFVLTSQTTTPNAAWLAADCDGDGVTNGQELTDGTDPLDPCSLVLANVSVVATDMGDCDGDGVPNSVEINGTDGDPLTTGDNTDPNDPCDFNSNDQTLTPSATWSAEDCDGDGITNGDELTNGSNAQDPCDPNICDVVVPEGFTPNGDNYNDFFVIDGIDRLPNNNLKVFNRWGNLIYEVDGYDNTWNGTANVGLNLVGTDLPTGTYYYVLDTKDENIGVVTGYVYLKR